MKEGIHLYINVNGFNSYLRDNKENGETLARMFHWLDSYLHAMEKFIERYDELVYVEKLNNTRMHLVIYKDEKMGEMFKDIVAFSYSLLNEMKTTNRYNKFINLNLSVGADYGLFNEFVFIDRTNDYNEGNSIGHPANYAAKIENVAKNGEVLISKKLFKIIGILEGEDLESVRIAESRYKNRYIPEIIKINKDKLANEENENIINKGLNVYKERQKNSNHTFSNIEFTNARVKLNFENISLGHPKMFNSIIIYSDIRGFTKLFKEDGSNLLEMTDKTTDALNIMYQSINNNECTHIQFQGDRESAIRNKYGEDDYVLKGLLASLDILDNIKHTDLRVGIGCSFGTTFAAKVGMRGKKHNLILGKSVKDADYAEDAIALENEVAITDKMYNYLCEIDNSYYKETLSQVFFKRNSHYVTNKGLREFQELHFQIETEDKNAKNAKQNQSYRAYGTNEI